MAKKIFLSEENMMAVADLFNIANLSSNDISFLEMLMNEFYLEHPVEVLVISRLEELIKKFLG